MEFVPRHESITVEFTKRSRQAVAERFAGYRPRHPAWVGHFDAIEFVVRMLSMEGLTTVEDSIDHHSSDSR